jgi:putative endonuclease
MYFVYILKSLNFAKTYTGITDDLERRLIQHNRGYHFYTKRYLPWRIIFSEKHSDRISARKKEKYLKSAAGRKWIKRVLFESK